MPGAIAPPIINAGFHFGLKVIQRNVPLHKREHRLLIRDVDDVSRSAPHSNGQPIVLLTYGVVTNECSCALLPNESASSADFDATITLD
jgi:hypothetical protein